jgi:membrane protein YdbS with pleckstrin-like domain
MQPATIRPSTKTVWAAYFLAFAVFIAGEWLVYKYAAGDSANDLRWLYALPLIVFVPPVVMHMRRRFMSVSFFDDHVTIESGFLSRTRRTFDTAKVQDVTVKQTLGQRLIGTGDLVLETAGEHGAIYIPNLDRPRVIADAILNSSKRGRIS